LGCSRVAVLRGEDVLSPSPPLVEHPGSWWAVVPRRGLKTKRQRTAHRITHTNNLIRPRAGFAPGKKEAEKDLSKAAAAIDCVAFLTDRLAPSLPKAESDRLRAMVADLQINYAKLT